MSVSKEEAERIITDFDRVANRVDKKVSAMSSKMLMGIGVIIIIVIAVVVYMVIYRNKKGKVTTNTSGPVPPIGSAESGDLGSAGSSLVGGLGLPLRNSSSPVPGQSIKI